MNMSSLNRIGLTLISCAFLATTAACGGGYGSGSGGGSGNYSVGGTASGVVGSGLVLRDNGGDDLAVSKSGSFTFATMVAVGASYAVTVYTQPAGQNCTVSNGSGTMGSAAVTNVTVTCAIVFSNNTVTGTYGGVIFDGSGDDGGSLSLAFDGSGGASGSEDQNSAGTITTNAISATYSVAANGALTLGPAGGGIALAGGVSFDGNTLLLAQTTPGQNPGLTMLVKQGQGNFTAANVTGAYMGIVYDTSGDNGSLLTLTFDGAGNASGSEIQNNAGVIFNNPVSATYTVAADGSMTLTPGGGASLAGHVSADGNTLLLSQTTAGQSPGINVFVKQGQTTFTNANVQGTYVVEFYDSSGTNVSVTTLTFDGVNSATGMQVENNAGTVSSSAVTATYLVTADGGLTLTPGGGGPSLTGGVSADGSTLVLAHTTAGDNPGIGVGVSQSSPWDY